MRPITIAFTVVAAAVFATAPAAAQEKQKTSTSSEKDPAKRTVQLSEQNQSGVRGKALVYEVGRTSGGEMAKHRVDLMLYGLKSGETYRVHLHGGTCATGGQVITPLARIEADEAGRGEVTTTLAREKMAVASDAPTTGAGEGTKDEGRTSLFVQARLPDGTPVACGDVPLKKDE